MKDRRIVRLAIVAVLAVILGSLIGYGLSSSRLERSGKAYTEESVTQVLNAWSDEELLKRASVQFRDKVDPDELHAGFDTLAHRLGMMQSCAAAQGSVRQQAGRPVTALYEVPCHFDHGAATVHIALIRAGSDWQILGFSIDSPAVRGDGSSPEGLQPYKGNQT